MNKKIEKLLAGKGDNYIFPFFWIHGEDEATLRNYMKAIYDSNIRAVCVESRPHPDFVGPKWWQDMDVILDEARKRNMKVWILDDSHFPTGYANGAALNAPMELRRQNIICKEIEVQEGKTELRQKFDKKVRMKLGTMGLITNIVGKNYKKGCQFKDDQILSVSAARYHNDKLTEMKDITGFVKDGVLEWKAPEGKWKLFVCYLTRNSGVHRSYINMMKKESCKILIDAVYEPHYRHYADDFGTTIAGFFSDEPELGNATLYKQNNTLGTEQDLPWSDELEKELKVAMGEAWTTYLPLLWNNEYDSDTTAQIRYTYMDKVTRLVERDFSNQIGAWCRERNVEYIGHVIEDNNQHARTGSSLGHYYRGLAGQDMSGIDVIGGQVYPQGELMPEKKGFGGSVRDGEFYQFALAKLGSSYGAIDPLKKGRTMCELFGNYGWSEGLRLEKYLADHCMVRGINRFVPHAFSAKKYPDGDCPPHFYCDGNDPMYRHFGELMAYMNRISELISDGRTAAPVAILYSGEGEWTGKFMQMQRPAYYLATNQIDFQFIPTDVFTETDRYQTIIGNPFKVYTQEFKVLVVPYAQYVAAAFAEAAEKLQSSGCEVIFVDAKPEGIYDGDNQLLKKLEACTVIPLEKLVDYLSKKNVPEISLQPASIQMRYLHYKNGSDIYYFVNEDDKEYTGTATVPHKGKVYAYDAWNNCLLRQEVESCDEGTKLKISLAPAKSLIVIFDEADESLLQKPITVEGRKKELNSGWKRSLCRSIDYPNFTEEKEIQSFASVSEDRPEFSGFVKYETSFTEQNHKKLILEITDAYEGVEVFINDKSAGIQIVPPFIYDISSLAKQGENKLRIEVATTLERERAYGSNILLRGSKKKKVNSKTGIVGNINLYTVVE